MDMEKSKQEESERSPGISRREFLKMFIAGTAGALCFGLEKTLAQEGETLSRYKKDGWFFTSEEMKEIYNSEYNGEKILQNRVFKKESGWFGVFDGKEFKVRQEFFDAILLHLKTMIEQKVTQFIFRLDAFHGHLFVPEDKYSKFASLSPFDEARLMVSDKSIGVLYHNSEHLKPDSDPKSVEIFSKRNVIGWCDGRPIEILPLPTGLKRTAADTPGRDLAPYLKFAANKNGEFSINADGKEIHLDFSFDDNSYF